MKEKILKLIDLKTRIVILETTDEEKKEIIKNGSYAIAEGYKTRNMIEIEYLEAEIEKINL